MTTLPSDLPLRQRRRPRHGQNGGRGGGTLRICTYVLAVLIACDAALQFYLTTHDPADVEPMRMFNALPDLEALVAMSSSLSFSWDGSGSTLGRDPQGAGPGLVFTPVSSRSYELNLNSQPDDQVAITLRDEEHCFKTFIPRALVFTPQNWAVPRLVEVQEDPAKYWAGCASRVLHEVFSTDQAYHGLHVRTQPLAGFRPVMNMDTDDADTNAESPASAAATGAGASESRDAADGSRVPSGAEWSENLDPAAGGVGGGKVLGRPWGDDSNGHSKEAADSRNGQAVGGSSRAKGAAGLGAGATNMEPVVGIQPLEAYTVNVDLKTILRDYDCVRTALANEAIKCAFAQDTPWASYFYIISAPSLRNDLSSPAPLAFVASGVHGKEFAGFGAGGIIKTWAPAHGRLVIIDRMNARGIDKRTRYVPRYSKMSAYLDPSTASQDTARHDDLNRDFPADLSEQPNKVLPARIWELVNKFKPKLFLDLHEGWGYYAQLKSNEAKEPNVLVGNPRFSKGSSVIATENSVDLAQHMVEIVNANIKERLHRFEVLSPPISGGLARRVHNAFGAQSFVLETTQQGQALEKRISQHLHMVAGLLSRIGFLDASFRPAKVSAKTRKAPNTGVSPNAAFGSAVGAVSVPGAPQARSHRKR